MKAKCDCCSYDIVFFHVVRLFSAVKKERLHDLCLQFIWSVLPPNEVGRGIRLPLA